MPSKGVDAGLNFTYERSTEQVGYAAFGTNTTSGMIYFFEGMWFYTSQQLGGSEKFYDVYYKGSEYGGAAQLELKLGKRVKFFNQFSAEYGKMERFRFDLDQHLGDNDQLTYRYPSQTAIRMNSDTQPIIETACIKLYAGQITAEQFISECRPK